MGCGLMKHKRRSFPRGGPSELQEDQDEQERETILQSSAGIDLKGRRNQVIPYFTNQVAFATFSFSLRSFGEYDADLWGQL